MLPGIIDDMRQINMSSHGPIEICSREPVSVVIPYYNSSLTIADAVRSAHEQTRPPAEIIVVNDGSRREEARALDGLAEFCTIINLPQNRGVSVARNIGIGRARNRWIAFLDADDCWEPTKLEVQMNFIQADPRCRAIHCSIRRICVDGSVAIFNKAKVEFEDHLEFPPEIYTSALLVERDLLFECGLFDPNLRVCEDLDLFLRITKLAPIYAVPDVLLIRREQRTGASTDLRAFWQGADAVYRRFVPLFARPEQARHALTELNAEFICRFLYSRDWSFLRSMIPRVLIRDVKLHRLLSAVTRHLIKNRLRKAAMRRSAPQ